MSQSHRGHLWQEGSATKALRLAPREGKHGSERHGDCPPVRSDEVEPRETFSSPKVKNRKKNKATDS